MPKQTDITGTFRVPEEAWGKFWNTMLTIPGADITPNTRVETPATKKTKGKAAEGSTAACLILAALSNNGKLTRAQLSAVVAAAGKNPNTAGSTLHVLKKEKRVTLSGTDGTYKITAAGSTYLAKSCPNAD